MRSMSVTRLLPAIALASLACSAPATHLVFTSVRAGNADLYMRAVDGGPVQPLLVSPERDEYPAAAPSSGRLVFVRGERGARDLWLLDADGATRRLTSAPGDEATPAWSPDETALYYTRTDGGRSQLMRLDFATGESVTISSPDDSDAYPSISPDGSTLVFHSYRDGSGRTALFLSDADGRNQRRLTEAVGRDYEAAFSPDGRTVAFSSNRAGRFQIHQVDVQTREVRRIAESDSDCWGPRFLPRGERLVYSCGAGAEATLYVVALDGSRPVRLEVSAYAASVARRRPGRGSTGG